MPPKAHLMPARLIARAERVFPFPLRSRTRRGLLVLVFVVCYLLAASYHVIEWQMGTRAG